jgi:HK97 family phage major capsid protein
MTTEKDPISLVSEIKASMEAMKQANVEINAALKASVESTGKDAKEAISAANELAKKISSHSAAIVEMEQKLADGVMKGKSDVKTLGQIAIQSDAFKQFAAGNSNKFRIEANTITGQSGSPATNNDTLNPAQRLPNYIGGAFRMLRVQDVLPSGVTNSNIVEYTRELSFTNNAAEAAEGATKAESTLTFELVSAPVRTIAHFLKVSKQALEDAAQLQSYIDTRLRYGVELKKETQIVNGAGTGQEISGLTASGNYTAFTPLTGHTALDSLSKAIELVRVQEYDATAILMNPTDWGAIERLKDSNNRYIVGNPLSPIMPVLWGKPVVVTNSVTSGKLLVGAFDISHQVFNRASTVVEMFEQDDTNVQKNLLTVRAEARCMLATFKPASVYYGNLTL